jgi:tight adherence protein C
MPIHVYLFAAAAMTSVLLFVWALQEMRGTLSGRRRRQVRANLGTVSVQPASFRQVVLEQTSTDRIVQPVVNWLAKKARRFAPGQFLVGIEKRRDLAGANATWTIERLLAAKMLLGGLALLPSLALVAGNPSPAMFLVAGVFVVGGFMAPDLLLGARGRRRQSEIERSFPHVLDQLTICVEAGLGLDAALDRAARSSSGALAEELARVLQDVRLGASRQAALEAFVARTDVPEIRHFVVALRQGDRYGVPVAKALRVQATDAREARRARAEERAQKMSVKLLFPLMFCILPALFVVILGPAAIRIAHLGLTGHAH